STEIKTGRNGMKIATLDEKSRANGSRYGNALAGWAGENQTVSPGEVKFRQVDMKLAKLMGFVYLTDELLEDVDALGEFVDEAISQEFSFLIDDAIVRGDGVGKPLGILNSPATIT